MDNTKKKIKVNMETRLRCSICAIFSQPTSDDKKDEKDRKGDGKSL